MSTSTSADSFCFTKLSGSNYAEWAVNMKSALQSKYLWLITDGRELCPSEPPKVQPLTMTATEFRAVRKEYLDWCL
ncbi:hypothetical protein M404DRAFT_162274 [Pisolithus tinctorius Marx 270]|uniref:DUF4219 domain-containing protein n=1 Tax=Pisolithus tinctorius Marx 270 TaxID=870435 RepID=A0A0C3N6Y2_PISTI|nr:hypothetical protein M404DRAFT_162274 [Pisolithus tinctorius Marx 270]